MWIPMRAPKICVFLLFICFSPPLWGKSSGPDPKLTGGFGESTCLQCHTSHPSNEGRLQGGSFEIEGLPEKYEPGKSYTLTLQIAHPARSVWAFQLSARSAGQGVNRLVPMDANAQVKEVDGIYYIMPTRDGTRTGAAGRARYSFVWVAPEAGAGMVLFNAAGNAADGNGDTTGDYIYTAGGFSVPAETSTEPTTQEPEAAGAAPETRLLETPLGISLPTPADLDRGSLEIHIQHRFFQALEDSSPGTAFGIDTGANINLALNYALTDRISAGISRARVDQVISLTATHEIRTKSGSMWKMALHGGVAGERNFERHYSPFFQLATALDYGALRLNLTPTLVFNSRDDALAEQAGPNAVNPDRNTTFSLGIGADIALHRRVSIMGEYVPRLAGFGGFFGRHDQLGGGVAVRTWGHVFTIIVSKSRNFTPTKYAVDAGSEGVSLGFNIYRRIG